MRSQYSVASASAYIAVADASVEVISEYLNLLQSFRLRWRIEPNDVVLGTKAAASVAPLTACMLGQRPDSQRVRRAGIALLCLDHYARSIDSQTDGFSASPSSLHDGALAFVLAQRELASLDSAGVALWDALLMRCEEASVAERTLLARRHVWQSQFDDDLALLGKKNALMGLAPTILRDQKHQNDEAVALAARTLDQLFVVIQVLDDLVDWRDDLGQGNFTPLLRRAATRAGAREAALIADTLFSGGVAAELIEEMREIAANALAAHCTADIAHISNRIDRNLLDCICVVKNIRSWADIERGERRLKRIILPEIAYQ